MNDNVFNRDFEPSRFFRQVEQVNQKLLRGHWKVKAWESMAHRLSGDSPLFVVEFDNGITNEGIHHVLDRFTDQGSPEATLAPWHAGLIDNSGFSGVADADTMASHSGWTESTAYDESVRQALNFAAAASRSISDSVSFTMNATVTIKGLFVSSDNTKGGTTGTLFATALFATPPSLSSGNVLTANYSLSD